MILVAALAAFLACWAALTPVSLVRLRASPSEVASGRGTERWRAAVVPAAVVTAGTVTGLLMDGGQGAAIGFAVGLPAATTAVVWRRHRQRLAAQAEAAAVASACGLLAGLIRVGHVPAAALRAAARDAPVLAEAAAVQAVGGDIGAALRRQGARPGREALVELTVAWEVADRTGASLTATLDALVDRLTAAQKLHRVVAAELSAPRATGRILAVLPFAGLALGYAFGGDPLGFLTGSPLGQLTLVAGVGLGCAGVFWTEHIARTADG